MGHVPEVELTIFCWREEKKMRKCPESLLTISWRKKKRKRPEFVEIAFGNSATSRRCPHRAEYASVFKFI